MRLGTISFFVLLFARSFAQPTLFALKDSARSFSLVSIDCVHDSITIVTPQIPSVVNHFPLYYYTPQFSSCYDPTRGIYYLCTGQIMYEFEVSTGTLIDTFDFRVIHPNFLLHIVQNPSDGLIYGVYWNLGTYAEKFARFDPVTGHFLDTIPMPQPVGVGIDCKSMIDVEHQEYLIQSTALAAIDIPSGNVIYNVPFQNSANYSFDHPAYSCKYERIYGLNNEPNIPQEYFTTVDSLSAVVHDISLSPLPVNFYKQFQSGSCIDNNTDIFYYPASGGRIYGIDLHTGSVVYDHNYGPGFDFLFLESANNYPCDIESSKNSSVDRSISVYPDPASDRLFLHWPDWSDKFILNVYDRMGKVVLRMEDRPGSNTENQELNVASLKSGVYLLKIQIGGSVYEKTFVKI